MQQEILAMEFKQDLDHPFRFIDGMLLTIGLRINGTKIVYHLINVVIRVLAVFELYSGLVTAVLAAVWLRPGFSLYMVTDLLIYLFGILSFHLIQLRHARLWRLFETSYAYVGEASQELIEKFSKRLLVVIGAFNLVHLAIAILNWSFKGTKSMIKDVLVYNVEDVSWYHHILIAAKLLGQIVFARNLYCVSAMVYLFYVYLLHKVDECFYLTICSNYHSMASSYVTLLKVKKSVQKRHEDFEECFDILPFFWFAILFFLSSGFVLISIQSVGPQTEIYVLISEWLRFLSFTTLFFGVVLVADYFCRKSQAMANDFIQVIAPDNDLDKKGTELSKFMLMNELETRSSFVLTAWNFFNLDRSLILAFSGAIISFSVLFAQIAAEHVKAFKGNATATAE